MLLNVPFLVIVAASTLVDGLVAARLLFGARSARDAGTPAPMVVAPRQVARAFAATTAVFGAKVVLLAPLGLSRFGLIHLAYADLTILVPVLGLALLLGSRRGADGVPRRFRLTAPVRMAAWASLLLVAVGIDATWIEPFRLQVETATVPVAPGRAGSRPVRIGVLTDLQTDRITRHEQTAVDRLLALQPDVIVLPGDVFQGPDDAFERELPALRELLGRLHAPGGVYLVLGDVDGNGKRLSRALRSTAIEVLVDELARVEVGDRRLTIGGVALGAHTPASRRLIHRLETEPGDDLRLLVAHRPDVALGLPRGSRIDLVIAGHTHGGQVVVPLFGPPVTLSHVPRAVAAGGLHRLNGNPIYVSRGVGWERNQAPRIRFLCPPEITLITLGQEPNGDRGPVVE